MTSWIKRISLWTPDYEEITKGKFDSVKELQEKIKKSTSEQKRKDHFGDHPWLTSKQLKKAKDYLFEVHRIGTKERWLFNDKFPTRLCAYQDDMGVDEVRLDNGQVACLRWEFQRWAQIPVPKFKKEEE